MFAVAGGATGVVTEKTPVPNVASCPADRVTTIVVADAEVGVSEIADPPWGV